MNVALNRAKQAQFKSKSSAEQKNRVRVVLYSIEKQTKRGIEFSKTLVRGGVIFLNYANFLFHKRGRLRI